MTVDVLEGMLAEGARLEAALEPFRSFLRPDVVRAFVDRGLAALAAGAGFATSAAAAGQIRIYASSNLDVRARRVAGGPPADAPIVTLTRHTLVGNAGRRPFALRCWHQPDAFPNDVFDRRRRIGAASERLLRPGEAVALQAPFDAFACVGSAGTGIALTAAGPHVVPLAWHYDAASRHPIRLAPARKDWLFVQELLRFAGAAGDASLGPALVGLTAHPSHFVRWSAAKAARRVAPQAGRDAIRALAADPHPQLRAAAQALLAAEAAR